MTRRNQPGSCRRGGDELDALIGVSAGELLEWAWLAGQLAEWLTCPARAVAADHTQRYPHGPTLNQQAWMLHHINERIGALLDGDRGQP
jgi:hypothetical protein